MSLIFYWDIAYVNGQAFVSGEVLFQMTVAHEPVAHLQFVFKGTPLAQETAQH